jgi:hypothetical protein
MPRTRTRTRIRHRATRAAAALLLAAGLALAACDTTYAFDPVAVGDDGDRAPRPRTNSQFVRAVYSDLLGRPPEVYDFLVTNNGAEISRFQIDEQAILVGALDAVGDPAPMRSRLVAGLVRSSESALPEKAEVDDPDGWIADQFRLLLGREPNLYELDAFAEAWRDSDAVGPHTVVRALIGSREYQGH